MPRISEEKRKKILDFFHDHPEMSLAQIAKHFKMSKSGLSNYRPPGRTMDYRYHRMLTDPPSDKALAISVFRNNAGDPLHLDDIQIWEGLVAVFKLKGAPYTPYDNQEKAT